MTVSVPASIRSHNPGAMWPGPSSRAFHAVGDEKLADGFGNHIAVFTNDIDGAAAQFDLLQRAYVGRTVKNAIARWSGAEIQDGDSEQTRKRKQRNLNAYLSVIYEDTGLGPNDRLTAAYMRNPNTAIAFAKAMARHEAGRPYPMSQADWRKAHELVFGKTASGWVPKSLKVVNRNSVDGSDLGLRILARAKTFLGDHEDELETRASIGEWAHLLGRDDVVKTAGAWPWCADFIGGMCVLEGAQVPPPEDALLARAYLNVGVPVKPDDARPGDLCIKNRGQGMGHIGVIETVDLESRTFTAICGNSEDMVQREEWGMDGDLLLGIVRPVPSKLKPNGKKSIPDTINDSPSLKMQINAIISGVGAALITFGNTIYNAVAGGFNWFVSDGPEAADRINHVVSSTKRAAETTGVQLSAMVLVGICVVCMVGLLARQTGQKSTTQVVPKRA